MGLFLDPLTPIVNMAQLGMSYGLQQDSNATNLQAVRETNATNAANVKATNEANLEQVRLTNAANAEQANLAYQRSLPTNQVRDLMDAGMSKAGALNKLAGGGVYTPPALQAGVSQASTAQAPHFDSSIMAQAIERLSNLPANTMQARMQKEQIDALHEDIRLKQENAKREQERHDFEMWQHKYDKDKAIMLDNASSAFASALIDSGKTLDDFKSFEDAVRGLGLSKNKDIRNLTHYARADFEAAVNSKFEEARAQREQQNRNRAAYDAHQMSVAQHALLQIDYKYRDKEKEQQLLNMMRIGQGLIEDNNIKFQDRTAKEMENFVREAGIDTEADARALGTYLQRLQNEDETKLYRAGKHIDGETLEARTVFRLILRDFGELLMKVKL